jgi:hypothetical protein
MKSGALYASHRQALASLLQGNAAILRAAGLPLDPDEFVFQIATVWFADQHLAHPVIDLAFGDKG